VEKLTDRVLEAIAGNPPLSFFWVVVFANGQALAQFDPDTGKEVLFSEAKKYNQAIRSAMWLPFSSMDFAKKVWGKNRQPVACLSADKAMRVDLPDGAELILRRRGRIEMGRTMRQFRFYILGALHNGVTQLIASDETGRRLSEDEIKKCLNDGMDPISNKGVLREAD
jgi:hypothetical protein